MKCPNCNNEVQDNTKFCPECGADMSATQGVAPQAQTVQYQMPVEKPKKKKGGKIIISIAVILVLFVSCSVLMSDDSSTTDSSAPATSSDSNNQPADNSTDVTAETPENIYKYLSANYNAVPFEISEKAAAFLKIHPELFPAKASIDCESYINWSIEYKHLAKNAANYGDSLIHVNGEAVQVSELPTADTGLSMPITVINMIDYEGNQFYVFYIGSIDLYEGDPVAVTGLPMDMSSFTNTDNGETLCPVIAGSYISKELAS